MGIPEILALILASVLLLVLVLHLINKRERYERQAIFPRRRYDYRDNDESELAYTDPDEMADKTGLIGSFTV